MTWQNYVKKGGPIVFLTTMFVGTIGSTAFIGVTLEAILLKLLHPDLLAKSANSMPETKDDESGWDAPIWLRLIGKSPQLAVLVVFLPLIFAMNYYKNANHSAAVLVTIVWIPAYIWLLAQLNTYRIVRWVFSFLGTIVAVSLSAMVVFGK